MDVISFPVLLIICIVTHIIRIAYEIMKHRKIIVPNNFSFIIILIDMLVLWASWFTLCSMDMQKIYVPDLLRYTGLLLVLTGVILFLTALFTIKTLESYEGDLITTGIYSKIRHPMYLAFILWLIGAPVYFGSAVSFIFSIIFTANVLFWKHLEELELEKRFPDYACYRKTTVF